MSQMILLLQLAVVYMLIPITRPSVISLRNLLVILLTKMTTHILPEILMIPIPRLMVIPIPRLMVISMLAKLKMIALLQGIH